MLLPVSIKNVEWNCEYHPTIIYEVTVGNLRKLKQKIIVFNIVLYFNSSKITVTPLLVTKPPSLGGTRSFVSTPSCECCHCFQCVDIPDYAIPPAAVANLVLFGPLSTGSVDKLGGAAVENVPKNSEVTIPNASLVLILPLGKVGLLESRGVYACQKTAVGEKHLVRRGDIFIHT